MDWNADDFNRLSEFTLNEPRRSYGQQIQSFKELRVYQEAVRLCRDCYELTASFPKTEQYGLCSQLQRAAMSVPANVAEGWGRDGKVEFARFIDISMGSLCEVIALLHVAVELNYTGPEQIREIEVKADVLGRMLHKLRMSLRSVETVSTINN